MISEPPCTITLDREGAKWLRDFMTDVQEQTRVLMAHRGELAFIMQSVANANDILCQLETYFHD